MSYLNVPPLTLSNGVQIIVSDNLAGGGFMNISILDSAGQPVKDSTGNSLSAGGITQATAVSFQSVFTNGVQYLGSLVRAGV